ncbi:hypothetical protein GCM10007389_29210 [Pontibacter akesuensis]|nr:hypothetical protein GCM10007389_29210 [Pontibacter akesuensis]
MAGAAAPILGQAQTLPKIAAPLAKTAKAKAPAQARVLPKDTRQFTAWLQQNLPHINTTITTSPSITLTNLQPGDLLLLQQCPWLQYIDRGHRQAKEELELKDSDLSANSIAAVHARYPEWNGEGIVVSVKENPFDTTDIDLKDRILASPAFSEAYSTHATTMATIIAGGGNSSPEALGVVWGSSVTSSSFANLMPDETEALKQQQVSVQSHSYGVGVENYYGLESMAYDEQVLAYPELLHVFSSGNSGTATPETGAYAGIAGVANLTGQFKTSKNSLSVGALDKNRTVGTLSSVGPAYDGRVKPELVAHGAGGTSEAAAVASGVAAMVQQAYAAQQSGTLPPAALVKAVLINSADDVGNAHVDFESGYGNIDALGAVETVKSNRFRMGSLATGATDRFILQLPAGTQQLKVTLVWHDAAAAPDAPTALVNDLDLQLKHSGSGEVWLPWVLNAFPHPDSLNKTAIRAADHLNNVEQVTLQQPMAGAYEVHITGHTVPQGPQAYSLVYEYTSAALSWTYPTPQSSLTAGNSNRIRWSTHVSGSARLEYKTSGSDTWTVISDNINLSQTYYDWTAPDILTLAQFRLVTGTQTIISPEFILAPVINPAITLSCGEEVLLQWPAVTGATAYQVYSLQGHYMQPLLSVKDTVAILAAPAQESGYFAVAPVLAGAVARRGRSVAYTSEAEVCYIANFLPRQLVMDSVLFDLSLSTTYSLAEVALERLDNGAYTVVQVKPVTRQTEIILRDASPTTGLNRYRARVTTQQGQQYYSQTEEVFFTRSGFIQVGPNPVVAGQEVAVVAHGEGVAQLQLYNLLGQQVYTSTDGGVLKTVPTTGLPAGIYILRLLTERGEKLSTRLLVL